MAIVQVIDGGGLCQGSSTRDKKQLDQRNTLEAEKTGSVDELNIVDMRELKVDERN